MITIILPIAVVVILLALALAISYACCEFVVRLIGRGLGVEAAPENTVRRPINKMRAV